MEIGDLYGLAPDAFVPARGALAKALRAEGRRDEAAAVAKLRKPSAAAWAVNQLVRGSADGVKELFAAGDAVREAQADVLGGRGDARALRDAGARERAAVDDLVDAARDLLRDGSPATLERVAGTLHAAALDESARDAVREGRLARELRHAGLGLGEGADVFAAAPATAKPKRAAKPEGEAKPRPEAKPKDTTEAKESAPKRHAAAERKAANELAAVAAVARKQARVAIAKAAKAEERAGHALRAAQERRERAAQALAEAEEALAAAQAKAAATAEEHQRLRAELDGAEGPPR